MKRRAPFTSIIEKVGIPLATAIGALAAVATLDGWSSSVRQLVFNIFGVLSILIVVLWAISQYFTKRTREKERDRARLQQEVENLRRRLEVERAEHEVALRVQADDCERQRADDRAEFEGELAEREEMIAKRSTELAEIADCQTYTQELVISVVIGLRDNQDKIREDVYMTPNPQVAYKAVRPIVPTGMNKLTRLDDLDFTVNVENGDHGQIHVETSALEEKEDYLRIGLRFRPDLTAPTKWWMEYRPFALWRPFRESGVDKLAWDYTMRDNLGGTCSLTDFVVRFVFLDRDCNPNVQETGGRGVVERSRNENGEWVIEWHDRDPARCRYKWLIVGTPTT